jgi:hypothetical protein
VEVEKKIDSIYSLLQAAPTLPSGLAVQPPEMPTPRSLFSGDSASQASEISPTPNTILGALDGGDSSLYSDEASGLVDVIQMGIITIQEAKDLVESSMVNYGGLPWVEFPSELPLGRYRRERPFLLLALLALSSRKQAKLAEPLQSEFKNVISNKIVMEGERNLDLLQGLMVYLAW